MKCHDGVPEPASEGVGPLSLGGAASMLMGRWAWMGWPASPPPGAGAQYSAYAGSPLIPSPSPSAISGVAGKLSLTTSLAHTASESHILWQTSTGWDGRGWPDGR